MHGGLSGCNKKHDSPSDNKTRLVNRWARSPITQGTTFYFYL